MHTTDEIYSFLFKFSGKIELSDLQKTYHTLEEALQSGKDLYFLSGVSDIDKRNGDDDIVLKNSFAIDLDMRFPEGESMQPADDESILSEAEEIIKHLEKHEFLNEWSYVVFSGNGIHIHYIGYEHSGLDKKLYQCAVKRVYREFEKHFSCSWIVPDGKCSNIGRVFRLPGSINHKNKDGLGDREVRILHTREMESRLVKMLPSLGTVEIREEFEERERKRADFEARSSAERAKKEIFHERGESIIDVINKIPIEYEVMRKFECEFDGKNFYKEDGKKYGFFKPVGENFIASGGSNTLAQYGKDGYNTFSFAMSIHGLSVHDTIRYFQLSYNLTEIKNGNA